LFSIIIEVAVCRNILWFKICDYNVVIIALYLSHSLGGSARIDQMINKLGFSQSHVAVIDQSDVCLQRVAELP